jgi:hypothetical protein
VQGRKDDGDELTEGGEPPARDARA